MFWGHFYSTNVPSNALWTMLIHRKVLKAIKDNEKSKSEANNIHFKY